jgi:sarcosine oxidase subunit beta
MVKSLNLERANKRFHVRMEKTADVIIVGAGIHGSSLAFHLAQMGVKPMVLERRFLAAEATGRSSGLVRMHYDLEVESRLAWISFQYFLNWKEMVGGNSGFTRTGFVQIVRPEYIQQLRANVAMQQGIGIPALLITADDAHRLAPYMNTSDFEIAAYEPESGYADPTSTARSLMDAARESGARLVQDCEVTGIRSSASRVLGVYTSIGEFSAPAVVDAAGAWAKRVSQMVGLDLPVRAWQHNTLFIRRPAELGPLLPTVIDDINTLYFRPETGGLLLLGLEDGNSTSAFPEDLRQSEPSGYVQLAVDRICRRLPAMERGSLHSKVSGLDGITPDQRPILGQAGPEGYYLACGFSGTGFKTAPAVGKCMAELIVDGEVSTLDISPFRLERFKEHKPLVGEFPYQDAWL